MRDALNAGLPSDRFQVDWRIASSRVKSRLRGAIAGASPSSLLAEGARLINPPVAGRFLRPAEKILPLEGARALIQIPSDFQSLKAADRELALAWRLHTRGLFEEAFAKGYVATDLLVENGQTFYHLERNPPARVSEEIVE
jgi:predicted GNAT superfamily acetyltransferase